VHARVLQGAPENYRALVSELQPGDTLELGPGEYRRGLPIHRIAGSADAPIRIRGPSTGDPAVFVARAGANTVSIVDAGHIHISNLTLDGRNLAVDAVKAEGHARFAHHITLENLTIINHGANQQIVGISTKCPAWGWVVRGNRIHGAGTGMYFGDSDGSAAFFNAIIEHNLVKDPLGYAIQIKHQIARTMLDIAPRGRFTTNVRHNVLSKASGGSPGPRARPNLLVGHWPLTGEGSRDWYLIYGNVLHENPHEALFQGEGRIALYDNIAINRHGPGIHIQPHNDVPREVRILRNTVVTTGNPIVVRQAENPPPDAQTVAGNLVFSPTKITGGTQINNLSFPLERATDLLALRLEDDTSNDVYPRDERAFCKALDSRLTEGLNDSGCDFNGRPRTRNYCGAYAGHGNNPGWLPALSVKPRNTCSR
jgi:hypothetical protein